MVVKVIVIQYSGVTYLYTTYGCKMDDFLIRLNNETKVILIGYCPISIDWFELFIVV